MHKQNLRLAGIAAVSGLLGLAAVALPTQPAQAQMYLGWDFGNGIGVGIGTPPSAYGYHYCGLTATRDPYCRTW